MARRHVADRTIDQIDPRALEIVEWALGEPIPRGRREDRSPNFRGLPQQFWHDLYARDRRVFDELHLILAEDFPTFAALLLKVFNKSVGQIHAFIFNNAQTIAWNEMVRLRNEMRTMFLLFLKARQLGVSTMVCGHEFWQAWRQNDIECTVIAHEEALAHRLIRIMDVFYQELPDVGGLRPTLREKSRKATLPKDGFYFSDRRSYVETHIAKNAEARGRSSKHNLLSELAFYPDPQALLDSLLPQLPPLGSPARLDCSVIVESTPFGQNYFYQKWEEAKAKDSEWTGIFLPWMVQDDMYSVEPPSGWKMSADERDLMSRLSHEREKIDGKPVTRAQMWWRNRTIENDYSGDQDAFDQEYPSDDQTCFMLRTEAVFKDHMRYLSACCIEAEKRATKEMSDQGFAGKNIARGEMAFDPLRSPFESIGYVKYPKPVFRPSNRGDLLIWEFPKPGHIYVAGADSAAGINGRDNAVTEIVDVTTARQVAEFAGPIGPEEFTDHTVALCRYYNNALMMPEINFTGTVVLKRTMQDWNYTNVAREEKWDEVSLKKNKYGFYTNDNNKPVLISNLVWMIQEHHVSIASRELLAELSTFQLEGYTSTANPIFNAKGKKHDDRVVAFALALYAVRQSPKLLATLTAAAPTLPSAVDLGINRAIQPVVNDKLPAEIENLLGERADALPANPIRGYMGYVA